MSSISDNNLIIKRIDANLTNPKSKKYFEAIIAVSNDVNKELINGGVGKTVAVGDLDGSQSRLMLFQLATGKIKVKSGKIDALVNAAVNLLNCEVQYIQQLYVGPQIRTPLTQAEEQFKQHIKFCTNEVTIIYLGDILFDRLTGGISAPGGMMPLIEEIHAKDKKNTVFIIGNHDNHKPLIKSECFNGRVLTGRAHLNHSTFESSNFEIVVTPFLNKHFKFAYFKDGRLYSHAGIGLAGNQFRTGLTTNKGSEIFVKVIDVYDLVRNSGINPGEILAKILNDDIPHPDLAPETYTNRCVDTKNNRFEAASRKAAVDILCCDTVHGHDGNVSVQNSNFGYKVYCLNARSTGFPHMRPVAKVFDESQYHRNGQYVLKAVSLFAQLVACCKAYIVIALKVIISLRIGDGSKPVNTFTFHK